MCVKQKINLRGCKFVSKKGVSKNRGGPKWMAKMMENPIKMDDLGGKPYFWKHPKKPKLGNYIRHQDWCTQATTPDQRFNGKMDPRFQTSILMSQQEVNLCPPHAPCSHRGTQHQT